MIPPHHLSLRFLALSVLLTSACAHEMLVVEAAPRLGPRSLIVMIADGAGVEHWTLARFARDDLAIREFPVAALVDTRGDGHVVTGSAAGATALSTGTRTFLGAIGVAPDSTERQTVLEAAMARGMSTGLITTAIIADATPAAFAAHAVSRSEMASIARQMIELPVDVMMGGGRRIWDLAEERESLDLWTPTRQRYEVVESAAELNAVDTDRVTALFGVFADAAMPRAGERSPSLTMMMSTALDILDNDPEGFFLMVENEGSDTEAHSNVEREILVNEMLDFDDAVRLALEFQRRHPETLLVVTADHETGGISLTSAEDRSDTLQYSTGDHSAAFVPLFAIGPGADRFGGLKENREVGQLLLEAVGRDQPPSAGL